MKTFLSCIAIIAAISSCPAQSTWQWNNPLAGGQCHRGGFIRAHHAEDIMAEGGIKIETISGRRNTMDFVCFQADDAEDYAVRYKCWQSNRSDSAAVPFPGDSAVVTRGRLFGRIVEGIFIGWQSRNPSMVLLSNGISETVGWTSIESIRLQDGSQLNHDRLLEIIGDPEIPCMDDLTLMVATVPGQTVTVRLDTIRSLGTEAATRPLTLSFGIGAIGYDKWMPSLGISLSHIGDRIAYGGRYVLGTSWNIMGGPSEKKSDLAFLIGIVLNRDGGVTVFSAGPAYLWGSDYTGTVISLDLEHYLSNTLHGVAVRALSEYGPGKPMYGVLLTFVL